MEHKWSRGDKITFFGVLVAIVGIFVAIFVPEIRSKLGFASDATNGRNSSRDIIVTKVNSNASENSTYSDVFHKSNPLPIGFEEAAIGMPISVLQTMYPAPKGKLKEDNYHVDMDENSPFSYVGFFHDEEGYDPKVKWMAFYYRGKDNSEKANARNYVRIIALEAFGTEKMEAKVMGAIIEWSNIKGYKVELREGWYGISLAPTPSPTPSKSVTPTS